MNPQVDPTTNLLEVLYVNSKKVSCQGDRDGSKTLGHPLVYLNMGKSSAVTCPYCSRSFVLKQKSNRAFQANKTPIKK
jgi:uncharacterized Zn-finger protein